jgi:hypothetical protein
MFAYRQPTFSYGSPYTTSYVPVEIPPRNLSPPVYPNGVGKVSQTQLKSEKRASAYRKHQEAVQNMTRIAEARDELMGAVGIPNKYGRINNPKM